MRHRIDKRDKHFRSQEYPLYEIEYSTEGRPLDFHHPKADCFREVFPPNYNVPPRKSSVYSEKGFSHRSYDGNDLPHCSSLNEDCTIHEMSYHRYPDKRSYYLEKESSLRHDYRHQQGSYKKRTPSPSKRKYSSRSHRIPDQKSCRKRSSSRKNSQGHCKTNERRDRTLSRPHRHHGSNRHCSSGHSRTEKDHHSATYRSQNHRSSRHVSSRSRHRSPVTTSSSSDDSSSYSSSDSECSDDSFYKSTNCNSSPERRCLKQISRHHRKRKPSPDKHFHQDFYSKSHGQKEESLVRHYHRHDPSNHQQQKIFPLSKRYAERIYIDEHRFSQHFVPRNKVPKYKVDATRTVKVEREPLISDMNEQHLIFHQRCDNIEHMLGQLLERSQKHPLTRHDDSQSLNWKGLCL